MKQFIKNRITESISHKLIETFLDEDYPTDFNLEVFANLTSFKAREQYCTDRLRRIGSGSGRIVYMIDDTKVLKLAKNQKGRAQNDVEASYSNARDINYMLAKVIAYDDEDYWIEMELARKVTTSIFQQIIGVKFSDYSDMLQHYYYLRTGGKKTYDVDIPQELVDQMTENPFISNVCDYIGGYDVPVGDMKRLNSYGVVKRDGVDDIVFIDYGLTSEVYDTYYS